jgi:hypothetical protein
MRRHYGVIVLTLSLGLAAAPGPEDGGAPGKAYREYFDALGKRDWKTLYRVTTPIVYQHITQAELAEVPSPLPPNARLILSGSAEGDTAVLRVELRIEDTDGARSDTNEAPMRLQGGQWKVSRGETDDGGSLPALAFEPAETVRRMRELASALEFFRFKHDAYPKDAAAFPASLSPMPLPQIPGADAWGTPFAYRVDPTLRGYLLISFGADGKPDAGVYDAAGILKSFEPATTTDPKADIIVRSGFVFLHAPRGAVLD